jgi:hypothetical protein
MQIYLLTPIFTKLTKFAKFGFLIPKLPLSNTHSVEINHIIFCPPEYRDPEGAWSKILFKLAHSTVYRIDYKKPEGSINRLK